MNGSAIPAWQSGATSAMSNFLYRVRAQHRRSARTQPITSSGSPKIRIARASGQRAGRHVHCRRVSHRAILNMLGSSCSKPCHAVKVVPKLHLQRPCSAPDAPPRSEAPRHGQCAPNIFSFLQTATDRPTPPFGTRGIGNGDHFGETIGTEAAASSHLKSLFADRFLLTHPYAS